MNMQACIFIAIAMAVGAYQWVKHKGTKKNWEKGSIIWLGGLLALPVFFITLLATFGMWGQEGQAKEDAEIAARKAEEDKNPINYAQHHHNPVYECQKAIAGLAKYDFKWKDSMTNPAFVTYAWVSKDSKVIEMYGDQAQAQNGFGAYKNVQYSCKFDADTGEILAYNFE
ncbi:hypothetical protein [Pseudescherichia vulneris]|uniref:hypothetical protein n=1 Tax=Pseudescherichia vulneris TaxID=566 RepID=UPI0028AD9ED5|nr:hypothetical protein [Pseudescherichia vulneris]